jgi:hypothetical protein
MGILMDAHFCLAKYGNTLRQATNIVQKFNYPPARRVF